jgi:hypothetical protein
MRAVPFAGNIRRQVKRRSKEVSFAVKVLADFLHIFSRLRTGR